MPGSWTVRGSCAGQGGELCARFFDKEGELCVRFLGREGELCARFLGREGSGVPGSGRGARNTRIEASKKIKPKRFDAG